jgi:hypothetical protein
MTRNLLIVPLLLATGVLLADEAPKARDAGSATEAKEKPKDGSNLGMSVLGNKEAPKALVIVPWKSSEIGDSLGISTMLDDSRLPVDKEAFLRMLSYYEIRSEAARHGGSPSAGRDTAPAEGNAAQPATAAHRRKS